MSTTRQRPIATATLVHDDNLHGDWNGCIEEWRDSSLTLCLADVAKVIAVPKTAKKLHLSLYAKQPQNMSSVLVVRIAANDGGWVDGRDVTEISGRLSSLPYVSLYVRRMLALKLLRPGESERTVYVDFEWE